MEQRNLQKLLLETAIATIVCDGEIHEKEIAELNNIISQATYFKDFNGRELLKEMIDDVQRNVRDVLRGYLEKLKKTDLSPVQELLILEVILRIVYADERFDENEVLFIKLVRSMLKLHDETIVQRFGSVPSITRLSRESLASPELQQPLNLAFDKFLSIKLPEIQDPIVLQLRDVNIEADSKE